MSSHTATRISFFLGFLIVLVAPGFASHPPTLTSSPPAHSNLQPSAGRLPLILIPGLTGSRMENDPDQNGVYGEVWPNGDRLILDPWDESLLVLKLAPDGSAPFRTTPDYTTVRVGDILRSEYTLDFYATTIAFFTSSNQGYVEGKDFFVCPYDWRKDIQEIAFGALPQTLDGCINRALAQNPQVTKVNILAHSMGGLISRIYLADPLRAQKVHRLITLGSPLLGAPKIALALFDKLCFAEAFGLCFTNTDVLYELIQNYPAGYQIAPGSEYFRVYPHGYIRRDRDADGDGLRDGDLSYSASLGMLEEHNTVLAQKAQMLYSRAGGWSNGGTNGAEVFAIVGDQHGAIGTIVEYEERPWYDPWGQATIAYRSEITNGDGTVPLRSADMRDRANGVDLSGGIPIFYFDLDHGELPKNSFILQLASSIFSSPVPVDVNQLIQAGGSQEGPHTEPLPLNGSYLTIEGPVEVEVEDSSGKRLSGTDMAMDERTTIPDASLTEMGSTTFIFLQDDGRYEIRITGQEKASADIRLEKIVNDEVIETVLYDDLPVTGGSQAILVYDPAVPVPGDFALDQDGNGSAEGFFPPSQVLNAQESRDHTAPITSISFEGAISSADRFSGPVSVTLSASDEGGSGVAKIEYSLDGGKTIQRYQEPFQVDPQLKEPILAKATDRAGNEEARLVSKPVAPGKVYLPAIKK